MIDAILHVMCLLQWILGAASFKLRELQTDDRVQVPIYFKANVKVCTIFRKLYIVQAQISNDEMLFLQIKSFNVNSFIYKSRIN